MGSKNQGWEPIRIYPSLYGLEEEKLTRAQIEALLKATDPDRLASAGESFRSAAKLLGGKGGGGGGEFGIQSSLSRTANDLAAVWKGKDAAKVQEVLRKLHATAGALGDAMQSTGESVSRYAERLKHYRDTLPPAPLPLTPKPSPGIAPTPSATSTPSTTPTSAPTATSTPKTIPTPTTTSLPTLTPKLDPDAPAQEHLRKFNKEIDTINSTLAEGLAFDIPPVEPIDFKPKEEAPPITVVTTKTTHQRPTQTWRPGSNTPGGSGDTGGSGDNGGSGGTGGSGGSGGSGGNDGSGGTGGNNGGGGNDGGGGTGGNNGGGGDGGTGGTGGTGGNDGTGGTGGQNGPGGGTGPGQQDGTGHSVPPVIGGSDNPSQRTDLAGLNQNPLNPGPHTTSQTGLNPLTNTIGTHPTPTGVGPSTVNTNSLLNPNGVITPFRDIRPTTVFGGESMGAAATSELGLIRPGAGGAGSSFMPPPLGGGGGEENKQERDREIYAPENHWAPQQQTTTSAVLE
ncbi:WXG100 family type VII secretion target [Streptosporangium sp. NPDC000396]|uniref:WXG100 family type VII secretion target n=1 Tax=Streptosporangium sp. NPDC000396 TaxID=3366185 RepID=UPI0036B9DF90